MGGFVTSAEVARELFDWQRNLPALFAKQGHCGLIQAPPGAGKTLAAIQVIKSLSPCRVDIVAPLAMLVKQWEHVLAQERVEASLWTTIGIVRAVERGEMRGTDLLILDEAHQTSSEVYSKVYDIPHKYLLGLTATPSEGCIERLGQPFLIVPWDEARISPFEVEFVLVSLSRWERARYEKYTDEIRKVSVDRRRVERSIANPPFGTTREQMEATARALEQRVFQLAIWRRHLVHLSAAKVSATVQCVVAAVDAGHKVMVFAERIKQLQQIADLLGLAGVKYSELHSKKARGFEQFRAGTIRVLLSSKMVKQGYDDPSVDVGIVASFALTSTSHVQTLGRVVRWLEGKERAKIYYLLAAGTTDERVMEHTKFYSGTGKFEFRVTDWAGSRVPGNLV